MRGEPLLALRGNIQRADFQRRTGQGRTNRCRCLSGIGERGFAHGNPGADAARAGERVDIRGVAVVRSHSKQVHPSTRRRRVVRAEVGRDDHARDRLRIVAAKSHEAPAAPSTLVGRDQGTRIGTDSNGTRQNDPCASGGLGAAFHGDETLVVLNGNTHAHIDREGFGFHIGAGQGLDMEGGDIREVGAVADDGQACLRVLGFGVDPTDRDQPAAAAVGFRIEFSVADHAVFVGGTADADIQRAGARRELGSGRDFGGDQGSVFRHGGTARSTAAEGEGQRGGDASGREEIARSRLDGDIAGACGDRAAGDAGEDGVVRDRLACRPSDRTAGNREHARAGPDSRRGRVGVRGGNGHRRGGDAAGDNLGGDGV